jgi:hypothetical protein
LSDATGELRTAGPLAVKKERTYGCAPLPADAGPMGANSSWKKAAPAFAAHTQHSPAPQPAPGFGSGGGAGGPGGGGFATFGGRPRRVVAKGGWRLQGAMAALRVVLDPGQLSPCALAEGND